jgi:hypothetical protein
VTAAFIALMTMAAQSMAPDRPPFVGTEAELNDKAIGEEIARTEQTRQFKPSEIENELARQASCLVEKEGEKVDELLALSATKPGFDRRAEVLFNDDVCTRIDFRLTYEALTFRNALAAARYLAKFPSPVAVEVDAGRLVSAVSADQQLGDEGAEAVLRKLALCVLQFGPEKAHSFVVSPLRTDEEKAALAVLRPAVGQCIPPGEQIELSRTSLRGMLADALRSYRLAEPTSSVPGDQQ